MPSTDPQDKQIVKILSEFSSWCLCDDDACEESRNFDKAVKAIDLYTQSREREARIKEAKYHWGELHEYHDWAEPYFEDRLAQLNQPRRRTRYSNACKPQNKRIGGINL